MKAVQVLLSSYNGEKYIAQQIESICKQKGVQVDVLIRDDGSTDATCKIIGTYTKKYSNIRFYRGKHAGVQKSFFDLMRRADRLADYYAFADQDDYWLQGKLKRAVDQLEMLKDPEKPLLYASKVIYADAELKNVESFHYQRKRGASFGNALLENICTGCTEVFNGPLLELVTTHPPVSDIWHDWWLYLTAGCFGDVVFDEKAYLYYRQHAGNKVGMSNYWLGCWKRRFSNVSNTRGIVLRQTRDFCRAYKDLGKNNCLAQEILHYKKGWKDKRRLVSDRRIYRQNRLDDMVYRILFLFGFL